MFVNFVVEGIVEESSTIKSFYLIRADGKPLENYLPGQFVTARVKVNGQTMTRNYTLSDKPGTDFFRLTIKRENKGEVSQYFHNYLKIGSIVELSNPVGQFVLKSNDSKPVVLISGGVGITPMLSMLEYILADGGSREVFFLHSSSNRSVQPMFERLKELASNHQNVFLSIYHTTPDDGEIAGVHYDFSGEIRESDLQTLLPKTDMDYYLCGPEGFMQAMYGYLTNLGVKEDHIYYEFFGDTKKLGVAATSSAETSYKVRFAISDIEADWSEEASSLLDLAETNGLKPDYECRMGVCETCKLDLISGSVIYDPEPAFEVSSDAVLICCAKPKSNVEIGL